MASHARQSQHSVATAPRSTGVQLPDYEPPSHPLNAKAQRALQALIQQHSLQKLKGHLDKASEYVTADAGTINDQLHEREQYTRRQQARQQQKGDEPDERSEELERHLEELRARVEKMTQKMDDSIRKIIDGEQSIESMHTTLVSVSDRAVTSSQAANMSHPHQRARRAARTQGGEDTEDDEMADFDPTDPGATANTPRPHAFSLSDAFRTRLEDEKDRYQTHSLHDRYAQNNRYIGFRRHVHDALNPGDDAPPLPHASTWFSEGKTPAPGETAADGEEDGSDDDIAISRMRISTKCPLTLQEFKDPVTSRKCPHSFERDAIYSMMEGRGQQRKVRCPVPGCGHELTPSDLHSDDILVRKIRRIQKSRQAEADEDGLNSSPVRRSHTLAESVGSDSGEDIDAVERRTQRTTSIVPKREPISSRLVQTGAPPRSSEVVDLGDDTDETVEEEIER